MRKIFSTLLFFLLHFGVSFSQNLVPNGGFEIHDSCPTSWAQLRFAEPWFQPMYTPGCPQAYCGSTDYYNICGISQSNLCTVPKNYSGFQFPHNGDAYIGVQYYGRSGIPGISSNDREYFEVKLDTTLTDGFKYNLSYYVSLANSCTNAINRFDAFFTSDSLNILGSFNLIYNVTGYFTQTDPSISL